MYGEFSLRSCVDVVISRWIARQSAVAERIVAEEISNRPKASKGRRIVKKKTFIHPQTETSSAMNSTDHLLTKQSAAKPAQSLRKLSQQHSFVMFYIVCLQTEESETMRRAVTKLIRAYDRMNPEFAYSKFFSDLLIVTRNKIIENEGKGLYADVEIVYEYMRTNRLVLGFGDEAESSDDEETNEDVDDAMEAIRRQMQDL